MTLADIAITRSEMIALYRSVEDAYSEIEAGVADGNIDADVLDNLGESLDMIEQYLNDNRD